MWPVSFPKPRSPALPSQTITPDKSFYSPHSRQDFPIRNNSHSFGFIVQVWLCHGFTSVPQKYIVCLASARRVDHSIIFLSPTALRDRPCRTLIRLPQPLIIGRANPELQTRHFATLWNCAADIYISIFPRGLENYNLPRRWFTPHAEPIENCSVLEEALGDLRLADGDLYPYIWLSIHECCCLDQHSAKCIKPKHGMTPNEGCGSLYRANVIRHLHSSADLLVWGGS